MRRGHWITVLVLLATAVAAMAQFERVPMRDQTVRGGLHDPIMNAPVAPDPIRETRGTLDSIGTVYPAGNTYYDQQHNGTAGKMIGVDEMGFVHVVWMKGTTPDNDLGPRHVFYNAWDPGTHAFVFAPGNIPSGVVVDASTRAGYACIAPMNSGWVYPGFHQIRPGDPNPHAAAAIDFQPVQGIFNATWPTYLYEAGQSLSLIWPKVAVGQNGQIHMVSTESPADTARGAPQRVYYSRGIPVLSIDGFGDSIAWQAVDGTAKFLELDTVMVIGAIVAASPHSNRLAIAWPSSRARDISVDSLRSQGDNDLSLIISEDGGLNWGEIRNITNFVAPDTQCLSADTSVCENDTFRLYTDCAALFDRNDNLHLAFTTHLNFELRALGDGYNFGWYMERYRLNHADIWHWSEASNTFSNITRGDFQYNEEDSTVNSYWLECGSWQLMVQRPSLAEDSVTGYLYCSYQRYDTLQISAAGWPMSEAYVAVSLDNGNSWSEGTDVTNTIADTNAAAGFCKEERDITIADNITYESGEGYISMFYCYDGDAGTPLQDEGAVTLNPLRFQRIPINAIPATPINPHAGLRIHAAGTPITDNDRAKLPELFHLYQNYPNPFNPVTNIQFDLSRSAKVTLKVFNVLGENVATVFDGAALTAGVQTVTFDGSNLASGIYMYRLDVNGVTATRKMVLMK